MEVTDVRRQLTECPECKSTTTVRQIVEWGACEDCRRRAEEEDEKRRTHSCRWCGTDVLVSPQVQSVIERGAIVLVYCSDKCRQECDDYNERLRKEDEHVR